MLDEEIKLTIGRAPTNDVVLADTSISRLHAELICSKNGKLFLIDCHSSNGTNLIRNGEKKPISQEFLITNDMLEFGDIKLSVNDLLEAVSTKINSSDLRLDSISIPEAPHQKPWVCGSKLIRCPCGAVKQKESICRECGK